MPDPVISPDDFGAGLNVPPNQPATPVQQFTDPESWLRSEFNLPEGTTAETFADYFMEQQEAAKEAEVLRARLAEHEARTAQQSLQQVAAPAATPAAPEVDEYKLPWEPVKVDPAFRNLVARDPSTGVYVPTDKGSIVHQQAAQEMNRRAQYEQQMVQDMFDDPAAFGKALTRREIAELRKEMKAELETFKTQFTPMQEQMAQAQAAAKENAFIQANEAKLFAEGEFTPLGKEVDWIMKEFDVSVEVALAKAESRMTPPAQLAGLPTPAAPQRQSISKVQPTEKPPRFVDKLTPATRFAVEKEDAGVGNGHAARNMRDLDKKFGIN